MHKFASIMTIQSGLFFVIILSKSMDYEAT
jgi:hypothetical protein